ncbi:LpqB family beta-propeller domain-containing protein [Microbacterium sp. ARD31]|uniref:LpqB family beta-propeller domain-containing protein n=1 Tax=Microbacterium sp. ARD31 TaxID=2962576 RepID=UPI00288135DE|nr:LpqB family beta-propeller domain-containing protein [Microbacterium sp. ARD31]MDT0183293.1 LpqB family beta-propeller domain-containing protein [Microbacterium sp. ARD31]
MTVRRGLAALLAMILAVALTACAGLPTSGPVYPGQEAEDTGAPQDTIFLPDRPQPGAAPEDIVEGFIRAGSGPTDSWARAREFLAPEFTDWRPEAGVTVVLPGDRIYDVGEDGTVTLSVVAIATVDDGGAYEPVAAGTTVLSYRLAQQSDGEWRITDAPDGIVLDRDVFPSVYQRYSVSYFDPTWQYLVPDLRWFPTTNAATRVADALVNRPVAEWLADSVVTSFPEEVTVRAAVPVESGIAQVELSAEALDVDADTLDRMYTQLQASLATAGVTRVEMSVAQAPIDADAVSTRSARVSGPPLVLVEEGFGFLSGDELTALEGLSSVIPALAPRAVQVGPDRDAAAVHADDGRVYRVVDDTAVPVDERDRLVDPTIDGYGAVWSVPATDPSALVAVMPDGAVVQVADAFPGASRIAALSVSRDGTRMAAVVTTGARSEIWAAGVVRDEGIPVRLAEPRILGAVTGVPGGLAWLDEAAVGVLTAEDDASTVYEQVVGGPASTTSAPVDVADIAGGATVSNVRLRTEDGTLLVRRGANWQESATGIAVLATQQGAPQ